MMTIECSDCGRTVNIHPHERERGFAMCGECGANTSLERGLLDLWEGDEELAVIRSHPWVQESRRPA